ncbi:MAG: endonuclease III [Candidatus Gracilibacteria bacterium]
MSKKVSQQKIEKILNRLGKHYSEAKIALNFKGPFQLLVATILSAQCTDVRVNMTTPALFKKYGTAEKMAEAPIQDLEGLVRSTGFYKNKAKNIKGAAQMIVSQYGGEVPKTMDELLALPGVARKTANVVLQNAWDIRVGVVVDTHVGRLSRRLGLTKETDPKKVEQDLMKIVPQKDWTNIAFWLIDHGRAICDARKPKCNDCFLSDVCPASGSFDARGKWVGIK